MSDAFLHAAREADQQQIRDLDARIEELEAELAQCRAEHLGLREVEHDLELENERLREAISDALADLHPGISPYSMLKDAIK
jgi:regulator of replication initiation timing